MTPDRPNGGEADAPHSAAYFGPQRDFWWNPDYLALLAKRWQFDRVESVLDVGAGVGHWGMRLIDALPARASVIGLERDPRSVEQAGLRAAAFGLSERCRYVEGLAEALPFDDESFDLVTCQTLLMHVPDVRVVIREMRRVARPGGLILAAEPSNDAALMVATSSSSGESLEDRLDRLRFALTCERGKQALAEGSSLTADLLPGYFAEARLEQIDASINDKPFPLIPPYASEDQQALKAAIIDDAAEQRWIWSREDARRYFIAGGGAEQEFDAVWQRRLDELSRTVRDLQAGTFHTAGGGIQYVIGGRRPA
jgi:ubiquinone/menaquinone biosynthesis C-methylase UbiE